MPPKNATNADGQFDTPAAMRGTSTLPIPSKRLGKGDTGDDVQRLHEYLTRFGYFPNDDLRRSNVLFRPVVPFAPEDPNAFDDRTEGAVREFQLQQGLNVTGTLDAATLALMKQPRCGFPDQPVGNDAATVGEFVAQGSRWSGNTINYRFTNSTPDLPVADQRAAVRGALAKWAAVTPLAFVENATGGDMLVSWASGDHGDGYPFDGASGVLAHCFYPPPGGGSLSGDGHFDEAETWSVNTPPSGIDLPTVALHELGHGLGLAHSNVTSAVMYAYYGGPRRDLTADDITGIQSIYGAKFRWASRGGIIFNAVATNNADGRLRGVRQGHRQRAVAHLADGAQQRLERLGVAGRRHPGTDRGRPQRRRAAGGVRQGHRQRPWHIWQTAPNNGWSGWASHGRRHLSDPVVARNADGRLEVFVRGADNALWHIWQTAPNNGW